MLKQPCCRRHSLVDRALTYSVTALQVTIPTVLSYRSKKGPKYSFKRRSYFRTPAKENSWAMKPHFLCTGGFDCYQFLFYIFNLKGLFHTLSSMKQEIWLFLGGMRLILHESLIFISCQPCKAVELGNFCKIHAVIRQKCITKHKSVDLEK